MRWEARLVAMLALVLVGCSASEPDAEPDVGGAYAEVIRWFVDRPPADPETPVVFMDSLGEGFEMDLGLQATIVSAAEEFAEVRFVDDRSEAFGDHGEQVRGDGIFLTVGPAVADGPTVTIDAEEAMSADRAISWTFRLRAADDGRWAVIGTPSRTGP